MDKREVEEMVVEETVAEDREAVKTEAQCL